MHPPISPPPRAAHRLKKTLVATVIGGGATLLLLVSLIVISSMQIARDSNRAHQAALSSANTVLRQQRDFRLPDSTSNIPETLDSRTLVDVVAKNQPAVVRILSVYCADIELAIGQARFVQSDVCSAGVGSGSIISGDGYIATNGHVVSLSSLRALASDVTSQTDVSAYLDFAVSAQLVSAEDAAAIKQGVARDDTRAIAALEASVLAVPAADVRTQNEATSYGVQLSNEPMRVLRDRDRLAIEYSHTIVSASLVAMDFDQAKADESLQTGQFTSSDVALLKMKGMYPAVTLGTIDSIAAGDQLTAIGFPAFIDNSVSTDRWQTVPSVTQGRVTDIYADSPGEERTILATSVPIAQGSSGGPTFDDRGAQVGLTTYSILKCADLQCFGDGQVRDIADLQALVKKNNITLVSSPIMSEWRQALDAYTAGNFAQALAGFEKVKKAYPQNYLVSPLALSARQQLGSVGDVSASFQVRDVTTTVFASIGVVLLSLVVIIVAMIIRVTRAHHRNVA